MWSIRKRFALLRMIWVDGGYVGELVAWARRVGKWTLDIVTGHPKQMARGGGAEMPSLDPRYASRMGEMHPVSVPGGDRRLTLDRVGG